MNTPKIDNAIITISKEKLAQLPAASYPGEIIIVDQPEQVASAVEELRKADVIGFDTETRPTFRKGQHHHVALIQLSTANRCFLFRINKMGCPSEVIELLGNPELLKIGLSLHDDFNNLRKLIEFEPANFIDLQTYVKNFKIADNSLTKLYGILFGERICKGQRLTNWEAETLTEPQQIYAALDAYACVKIYNYLKEGKFNPLTSPYLTYPEPSSEESNTSEELPSEENNNSEEHHS